MEEHERQGNFYAVVEPDVLLDAVRLAVGIHEANLRVYPARANLGFLIAECRI